MPIIEFTFNEKEFLKPYVEEWPELAAEKLERADAGEYLISLDDMIVCYGFDKKMEFYNEIGVEAQRIYDRVIDACDDYDDGYKRGKDN